MKHLFHTLSILICATLFAACGDAIDDSEPEAPIAIHENRQLESSTATSFDYKFSSSENWTTTTDADWVKVVPVKGAAGSDKTITINVEENFTTAERKCTIRVTTISSSTLIVEINITQPASSASQTSDENSNAPEGMKKNARYLVQQIKVGWNLGNTCESGIWDGWNDDDLNIETNWGNPKTTKAMFTALKKAGFNAVRIPVRWTLHADNDMNINDRWMERVKEIVDYAVSQDMYVVLNSHHDNWYDRLPVGYNESEIVARFEKMWTQIATAFRDYDEHLILAGANEIIKLDSSGNEQWGSPNTTDRQTVRKLMQTFVDAVRATGGNNAWRCLMIQPWAANPAYIETTIPTDKVENRLIQEFHCYDPYNYAIGKDQNNNQWGVHEFTDNDRKAVINTLNTIKTELPLIMAEFGSTQDNHYSNGDDKADAIRADYHKFIVSEAKKLNIPCFYWDNGAFDGDGENFGLLDRKSCTFPARAKIALQGIMDGLN